MSETKKCIRCGGERLEPGRIQSTGRIYFRPENTQFLQLKTADIAVTANICLECGTIELVGDVVKVSKLVERVRPH